ncbi:MAG: hypothetical protein R2710_28170 [Acidimicrobiales bacterium]
MSADRNVRGVEEFSRLKIRLQLLGSWVVRRASETEVPDATSGFRAYDREAAIQLTVVNRYTYTIESLIQAGKMNAAVASIPVDTNAKMRESRLFGSMWGYIRRNILTIGRVFAAYEPLKFFSTIAAVLFVMGLVAFIPFAADWLLNGDSSGHLQSIVLGAVLVLGSLQVAVLAVVADLISSHRMVSQRILERVRRVELQLGVPPSHYEPGTVTTTTTTPTTSSSEPPSGASRTVRHSTVYDNS